MCAHWYPEGYVLPTSTAYPPGPYHPAYTQKLTSHPGAPNAWLQIPRSSEEPGRSSRTRRSSSSSQTQSTNSSVSRSAHIMAGIADPGLVSGVDYFKIGETVRVRRLTSANTYTDWAYGQVTRPHLRQYRTTEPERVYYVSYVDPRSGGRKENEFSCYRKEIAPLYEQRHGHQSVPVFALIPLNASSKGPGSLTWVPAKVTNMSDSGVDIQTSLDEIHRGYPTHFRNVHDLVPFNASVARCLRSVGQKVVGDGKR